ENLFVHTQMPVRPLRPFCESDGQMSDQSFTSPDEALRSLYERLLDAWNRRDASAMADLFTSNGNLVGFDGSQVDSRAAIADHLRPIFADHPTPAYVGKVREVRTLAGNVGILRAVAGMVPSGSQDINPF